MEQKDLSELQKVIQKAAEENGFDILDLAAAFMQMSMGDEPEESVGSHPRADGEGKVMKHHFAAVREEEMMKRHSVAARIGSLEKTERRKRAEKVLKS